MNELGVYIFLVVSWFIFALFEGITEARLWHYKYRVYGESIVKTDSHTHFVIQRGIVLLLVSFVVYLGNDLWVASLSFIANALTFSFIHNGMMYTHRNYLSTNDKGREIYPKEWFDQSTNSNALTTKFMTPVSRTIQFVVGLGLHLLTIFYLI